ncbi:MAG TPA: SIS domain-containing protein [Solirubrobacteraceae bacterium]|jgi:D-sedoheptulose 7-phosphate isomerase|nr:SIS domain-containing protein [Solirubrobacteraceae bacterium]
MPALASAAAERRRLAGEAFFGSEAERIARLCHRMAERFARGGRLIAFGEGSIARSDARHVAVEFVHPVIVGKRALPALALTAEGGPIGEQVELLLEPQDIALAFGEHPETVAALGIARERGCLTLAVARVGAEWEFVAEQDDPLIAQELVETLYHVLWELVHVFFEHRGLLEGRSERTVHDTGASSFLYPFLGQREDNLDAVVADVRASVLAKAAEVAALRAQTLGDGELQLRDAARDLRARLDAGGRVLALGNGGSATDAMDAVADLRSAPAGWPARAAIDLTEDPGILTAIANDVGVESIFSRQIIAHGRAQDALLAFSTSGGSRNVLAALEEARRRGMLTVALVGYDGGRIAAEGLADHVIVTRSEHIPRIQEAQASAWHVLRELIELGGEESTMSPGVG